MKITDINIGQEIKKIVEEKYPSYSEFGRKIGKSRQNIQSQIFSKSSLHTDMLVSLSNELGVNLFELYQDTDKVVNHSEDKPKISLTFQVELTPEEWRQTGWIDKLKEL